MTEAVAEIAAPVPAPEPVVETPNPILDPRPEPAPEPVKAEKRSVSDALSAAEAKVNAAEKPDAPPVKTAAKDPVTGKFAADPAKAVADPAESAKHEAPARFTAEAKAEWEKAPEKVRAEVNRMQRELEAGFTKHKEAAELFEPVRKFHDMAVKAGTTIDKAMERYVAIDQDLANPDVQVKAKAIEHVLKVAGVTPLQYAAWVSGQSPETTAAKTDATSQALQAKIEALENHIAQISGHVQQQQQSEMQRALTEWAADKPDADDLANEIAAHVQSGLSLDDAYAKARIDAEEKARRLGFIPALSAAAPAPEQAPQPRRIPQSISGSPSSGSNPAQISPSSSVEEAIRKAFLKVG